MNAAGTVREKTGKADTTDDLNYASTVFAPAAALPVTLE
jgi:hypothetical protein